MIDAARPQGRRLQQGHAAAHQAGAGDRPRPAVLMLDEPLNGLDPLARAEVIELFRALRRRGPRTSSSRATSCTRSTSSPTAWCWCTAATSSPRARSTACATRSRGAPAAGARSAATGRRCSPRASSRGPRRRGADRRRPARAPGADRDAEQFYLLLNRLASEGEVEIEAVAAGRRRRAGGLPVPDRRGAPGSADERDHRERR